MPDEKYLYKYENLPIPSYEEATEATSSRTPTPSTVRRDEPSNVEERQGLMGNDPGRLPVPTRRAGYRPPPTVESSSVRDSLDDVDFLDAQDGRESSESEDGEVRREMEEMEMLDPAPEPSLWTKRISSISQSLHLPFELRLPNWNFKLPKFDSNLLILLGRVFAIMLVVAIVYILFMSDLFTTTANRMAGQMYEPESVRVFVQDQMSADNIRSYLQRITQYDHVAGTEGDFALSQYVEGMFAEAGLEKVWTDEYEVYLNYPKAGGRAVQILNADGSAQWSAKIEEEQAYDPPRQQSMVFHGHSKSGNVTGPLIYANYGSREDFKRLYDSGIETTGAIALVKYYGNQGDRALKVKAAEEVGFVGCIIYSDPADDGFVKGEVWPNGRFMPSDGVQRGAVSLMSWVIGDVLTPGWPSKKGQPRMKPDESTGLTKIPSIPLAWRDAQPLLQAIKGFGQPCPEEWHGGVPDVEWWSGNLSSPIVHLMNEQDEVERQPIWNVMGRINGVEQREKSIIVGNHRDAWAFGGADPGSGTAVLLEVVRIFGVLVSRGWRPLRTIEFASWDGEEYNLIGSTEFVEDNIDKLRKDCFAYVNVDVAVTGQEFHASASPLFQKALLRVLDRTSDPSLNISMRQAWDERGAKLEGLGAGSDYVAFQDMAGTSSIDLGFSGDPFPYHSVYDNFEWMEKFGDPGFEHHRVLAQIEALLILELASLPVIPFDMSSYSSAITRYTLDLDSWAGNHGANQEGNTPWSIEPLREAVLQFNRESQSFDRWEQQWEANVYPSGIESVFFNNQRLAHNTRMGQFEADLLDLGPNGDSGGVSLTMLLCSP